MSLDQWEEAFRPIDNSQESMLFETFGDDAAAVASALLDNPRSVWTRVETDAGQRILPGEHKVNRVGYYITEVPAPDNLPADFEVVASQDEKYIFFETTCAVEHVETPTAMCLKANRAFVSLVQAIAAGARDLHLKRAVIDHTEDFVSWGGEFPEPVLEELTIEPSGLFSFGGDDAMGARIETHWYNIAAVQEKLDSINPVEVMNPVSHVSMQHFIQVILADGACNDTDEEGLALHSSMLPASEMAAPQP